MRRFVAFAVLLAVVATPVQASAQSLAGASQECGTYTWKADLTKGRTDSMLIQARHIEGCFTYDYMNYAPAGKGETQGNSWQMSECDRARQAVANHFKYYRGLTIDPANVKISCTPYHGAD